MFLKSYFEAVMPQICFPSTNLIHATPTYLTNLPNPLQTKNTQKWVYENILNE